MKLQFKKALHLTTILLRSIVASGFCRWGATMHSRRPPPLKPLTWAGRICIALGVLMVALDIGPWTGVTGQVINKTMGENRV